MVALSPGLNKQRGSLSCYKVIHIHQEVLQTLCCCVCGIAKFTLLEFLAIAAITS